MFRRYKCEYECECASENVNLKKLSSSVELGKSFCPLESSRDIPIAKERHKIYVQGKTNAAVSLVFFITAYVLKK